MENISNINMACQNDINSTSQDIMQLSKYCCTWLDISCNYQNIVQLLEIYHATQEGCIFLGGTCIMTSEKSQVSC